MYAVVMEYHEVSPVDNKTRLPHWLPRGPRVVGAWPDLEKAEELACYLQAMADAEQWFRFASYRVVPVEEAFGMTCMHCLRDWRPGGGCCQSPPAVAGSYDSESD